MMQKASPNRLSSQSNNRYKRYSHHIHNLSSEEDSGSLMEKPMQDLPQNAQEAQRAGRFALILIQAL